MWFLSILFSLIGSATNLFFSLRYPSISITPVIALLLAHPLGLLWDRVFRDSSGEDPNGLEVNKPLPSEWGKWKKVRRWLGQGKWNRKEHCCVYISSNVSFGFAFATDVSWGPSNLIIDNWLSLTGDVTGDGIGYRGANTLLPPEPRSDVSNSIDTLYTDFGVYVCGTDETVVSVSWGYDLA